MPVTTLKKVVFPAPLGPIRAVIDPSRTSSVAPLTARTPPKRLTTASVSSSTLPFLRAPSPLTSTSLTEDHLLALAEHPLGPERHQQDQKQARDEEAERRDLGLVEPEPDEAGALQHDPEDHRASEHAPVAGEAAEDQNRVGEEGGVRLVVLRMDRREVEGQEVAREGTDPGGDRERLELVDERVLPQ